MPSQTLNDERMGGKGSDSDSPSIRDSTNTRVYLKKETPGGYRKSTILKCSLRNLGKAENTSVVIKYQGTTLNGEDKRYLGPQV